MQLINCNEVIGQELFISHTVIPQIIICYLSFLLFAKYRNLIPPFFVIYVIVGIFYI